MEVAVLLRSSWSALKSGVIDYLITPLFRAEREVDGDQGL